MRFAKWMQALAVAALLATAGCGGSGSSASMNSPGGGGPDTTPPSIPTGANASKSAPRSVTVSWSASTDSGTGVAGYHVFRNGGATPIASVAATMLTYTDGGLNANTDYSYTVTAYDGAIPPNESAHSAASNIVHTDPDTTAPSAPQNLTAVSQSNASIALAWQASMDDAGGSGLAGYRVFRAGTQIQQLPAGTLASTDTGLSASTSYAYTVRAYDNAGNVSAASNTASATTGAPPVGMSPPRLHNGCIAPPRPGGGGGSYSLAVQRVFPNLAFGNGNGVSGAFQAPNDNTRWFVTELDGHIRSFPNNNGATSANVTTFLDISGRTVFGGEEGLFGIAFHPSFPADPRAFVTYTTTVNGPLQMRVSQFTSKDGGLTLDPTTEIVLLSVNKPATNHNGGFIAFGPVDGMLYVGLGDGGSENDPWGTIGNGQNTQTLMGKILRIDVSGTSGSPVYGIPPTNPFSGNASCGLTGNSTTNTNCPEIYAWGLRNPWRGSFDRQTGKLWIGDVGQNLWEEIDQVTLGGNYGWRCREGANPFMPSACGAAPPASLLDPVAQFYHTSSTGYYAVIGGYVYRGASIPALQGQYVFADFLNGLYTVDSNSAPTVTVTNPISIPLWVSAFAQDQNGELFVVEENGGRLFQLISTTGGGTDTIPGNLSGTGCIGASAPTQPASGLIPYAPNAPFWSDGAGKRRWIGLPDGQQIDNSGADGDWNFPNGTVLMKDFTLGGKLIETRLLMHHPDGTWAGYVYQWNAGQTDATRLINGADLSLTVNGQPQTWHIPSEAECLRCHTAAAGYSLGLETGQLNGNYAYPASPSPPFTGLSANQLQTLNNMALLALAISDPATQPVIPDPQDTARTLDERARAWLHTNCSQCHRPGGGTTVYLDLRYTTAMASTNTCNATPVDNLGIAGAMVISPGNPGNSILYLRMNQRGTVDQMPPLASNLVDSTGAALLQQWITAMNSSCQ